MSEYREKLQKMMLRAGRGAPRRVRYQKFYDVCEFAADALFLAGWAVLIIGHI